MKNAIVPLFCTDKLDATKAFYQKHMGFRIAAEMEGYAELEQGEGGPRLGFMSPCEKGWPAASSEGLLYCFQVEDADAEHERLRGEGVKIVQDPDDKPWGERGFVAADPNGISLYIGHLLEPAVDTQSAGK